MENNFRTINVDKEVTDAPYSALKALGEIGQRVIDYHCDLWSDYISLYNDNEEIAIALSNLVYFIMYDNRYKFIVEKNEKFGDYDLLVALIMYVCSNVNNFNTERFISMLSNIDADFTAFKNAYEGLDVSDDDIEYNYIEAIGDVIIDEFNIISDHFKNAHDEIEYNFFNKEA